MKPKKDTRPVWQPMLLVWLLLTLLLIPVSSAVAADYMKDSKYFKLTSYKDHVQFEILLTDLYGSNTFAKGGKIRAYNTFGRVGTSYDIMELYTKDMNNDYSPEWDVFSRIIISGGRGWFVNGSNSSSPEITTGSSCGTYSLHKGSDNDYLTAKIDFYFPPQMANLNGWYFYYEYDHNKGSHYDLYIGSAHFMNADCSHFDTSNFSYSRVGADKIKITLPAMPNDVPQKLKDNRWHVGVYNVTFYYTQQNSIQRRITEKLECQVGSEKTYEITIPEEIGNFRELDLAFDIQDALKCENEAYFWNDNNYYFRNKVFQTVPVPNTLNAEYYQFDNKVELTWNGFSESNYIEESIPYVYRLETDAEGMALSGKSWEKRATLSAVGKNMVQTYTDKNVSPNTYYKYMVVNVPKEWTSNNSITSNDLNSPSDKLLNRLGYTVSDIVATPPAMSIYNLAQDITVTDKVRLTWEYTRVPVKASSVTFNVLRRTGEESEWTQYGNVTADAEPTSGQTASFIDSDLPNNRVRYEYKIVLNINNGENRFESDVIQAGLLNGSTITKVEATKGTHDDVVRVSWKVKQVGTDNTNFTILRRYAGTQDEFLKVYSTSGQSDSYTYEDNTVLTGYYYEYRVEAYSGEKDSYDDNTYQNCMSDVGFCQARGVISGRVTYGTGTAVEDVRINLRASGDSDNNDVQGFSQYVEGTSSGVAWKTDSVSVANVFGQGKNYTVQMFVRPELGLGDAVVASIPNQGMVMIGEAQDSIYKLLHAHPVTEKISVENYSNNLVHLRALYCYPMKEEFSTYSYNDENGNTITVYSDYDYHTIYYHWLEEGFEMREMWAADWLDVPNKEYCAVVLFTKTEEITVSESVGYGSRLYDTGLRVPASTFSLISVQNSNGNLTFGVNGNTSSDEQYVKTLFTNEDIMPYGLPSHTEYKGNFLDFSGSLVPNLENYEWMYSNYVPEYTEGTKQRELDAEPIDTEVPAGLFAVGGVENGTSEIAFKGNFTEVRVWDHLLTEKEQQTYADRMLNGREKGLALYWPMDEGIDRFVFDASYTNDVPNGRHASVGTNIRKSTIIPSDEQLSRYGMTNKNGEFTITGIPFIGSGSTYTITPTKNIHNFSPISRNGFIGNGSIALNGYDFTDMSSFPVRGTVTYLNTNIPVDSVQFKIDGQLVQGEDRVIMSDANGQFEISVPIGNHRIEAYRNGHHLTSFPMDPSGKWDFKEELVVNFIDSTLVNVTGRINGGFSDQDQPLGFGLTKNRLGKATVKLSLGRESMCSFNYIVDDKGSGEFGTVDIPVESASANIHSTARRAGGSPDDTHYVYITTDEETGEFSAMLPPLKYKVESIKFVGGTDYDNLPIFAENLPVIDATNAVEDLMQKDSVMIDNEPRSYTYSAKQIWQYRATPDIKVYQEGMQNGAFGEVTVALANPDETTDSIQVLTFNGSGYHYVYGHPIFLQEQEYQFGIDVAEHYTNLDTKETFNEIPKDAEVSIINDASMLTIVYGEKAIIDGKEVEAGTTYDVQNIKIIPDSDGHVSYNWTGGWPNLGTGYLRNLSIGVTVDGRTTMWKAPDSATDALDLIMLGALTSGTNFVTDGPNHVDMILRRPPGSTSKASLVDEAVTSVIRSSVKVENGSSVGGGAFISLSPTFEITEGAFLPVLLMKNSKLEILLTEELKAESKWWDTSEMDTVSTYTVAKEMTTSQDYIQNGGDTYIGRSTNMLFGKGRLLGIYKGADGSYKLDVNEALTIGETFSTTFVLPQDYILNTLIPNWQAIIDSNLRYVDGNHWEDNVAQRVEGEVRYYTKYKPGDPEYGRSNADVKFWGVETIMSTNRCPSYRLVNGTGEPVDDVVGHAIDQINQWKNIIALNEQEKLEVIESRSPMNNYSIAGGTSVSESTSSELSTSLILKEDYSYTFSSETKVGVFINDAGFNGILTRTLFHGETTGHGGTASEKRTVSWNLSDADSRTALSVDMYPSDKGWGPIFRTRGGQSANPYEGATYTLFYNPGTQLDEATMRVEYPQLRVQGATEVTDVPTGGAAKFILEMTNLSETNSSCTYILEAIESANAKGAVLMIDGQPLSLGHTGRAIPMNGNETLLKTLFVSQSDRSVTDFDDIKLVLRSEKDGSTCSDTLKLKVHFVPASAIAEIKVDHTVLTQNDENKGFLVTVYNLDRQDEGLRGVRIQYRRKGTDAWTLAKQWVQKEYMTDGDDELPEGSSFSCTVTMLDDGDYELRAQTYGKYGNDDVTYETDIIDLVQDLRGPQILGMPYPTTGTLFYDTRNNMHIRFNESINVNALSKSDNFRIDGYLNNASFSGQFRDVALQLNGDEIQTQATYTLADTDIAFDMWFYRQGDGNIISMGTEDNQFALFTHDGGQIAARVGAAENTFDTGAVLPADKWTYIALSYKKKKTADDPENRISMLYVNADMDQPEYVGKGMPAKDMEGVGHLTVGGKGMRGMMHDLTLWNTDKSINELYESREEIKAAYTPGLVGYWRMDEGHGITLYDKARSRNMVMNAESWYINNRNLAAHLDGTEPFKVDISTFAPRTTDNYALEMWFRGDNTEENRNAMLMSVLDRMKIGFQDGKLVLMKSRREVDSQNVEKETVSELVTLSEEEYNDNEWHHFAFNVRRGTSAVAYIDGKAVKTLPEGNIPAISSHYLYIGGEETLLANGGTNATNLFTGDIDEVRIWNAALTGKLIEERRYERLDSTYSGLIGYFPMESIHRIQSGTVVTEFNTGNFGFKKLANLTSEGNVGESLNSPALLPGSQRMRFDNTEFDFTASEDEIYFSFPSHMLAKMDGNDFIITVENVKDKHGNSSEPIEWAFSTNFATLSWVSQEVNLSKKWDQSLSFINVLRNSSSTYTPQGSELEGMPSWLTVTSVEQVSDNGSYQYKFTIEPNVPVGRYTEYIYVTDELGSSRVFKLNLTVKGDEPDWTVNPNLYESNMALTGQIYVRDRISEYTDSKIAAFDAAGLCRGVASPKYVASRDAYYVDMIVYGSSSTELTSGQRDIYFKMYDASTGKTYPVVNVTLPDGTTDNTILYAPDAIYGSYDSPVVFRATDMLQQLTSLPRGWTWMSLFVDPVSKAINDILPSNKDDLKNYKNIKGHHAYATVASDGSNVLGELQEMVPGDMYKIQVSSATTLYTVGYTINVKNTEQVIYPGYNWIGSLSNAVMSPAEAFAELEPMKGDLVKNRTSYATYNGQGLWEGTLNSIVPGQGYIYLSKATETKSFHYPVNYANLDQYANAAVMDDEQAMHYQPADEHLFPDNMNITAVVVNDGQRIENAEVGAFINGECRGAVLCNNGYYFLTIMGSSTEDLLATVEIRVFMDGEEFVIENEKSFISDAIIGTLEEPYVLDLSASAIRTIADDGEEDTEWYTLEGFKIGRRPTKAGVYIHRGEKVAISSKRQR